MLATLAFFMEGCILTLPPRNISELPIRHLALVPASCMLEIAA